jgi:carboxylesterase type B
VAGESAGGLSTMVHTKTELPLFNRAIIMSPPSWPFQSIEKAQEKFDSYVLRCGLQLCDSPEAKIAALRNASVQQMVALLGHPAVSATYDQQFFSGKENQGLTCEQIETSRWIEKITIGWTKDEIALWSLGWRKLSTAEIISLIRNTIPEDESSFAEEILAVYGFSESMEKESALAGLIQLGTDSLFTSPPLITARHATCPVSVYRFDQVDENTDPNNKLQGLSYHGLDCNFFFRRSSAVGPKASTTERQTADTIAEMVMDMVYGQDPWAPISPTVAVTAFQPMIINGGLRGPREVEDISRVYQLTTSQEKHSMFTAIGHKLVAGASIFE